MPIGSIGIFLRVVRDDLFALTIIENEVELL